jgi:pyruvate,water dikinase
VDVTALDDLGLADHVESLVDHLRASTQLHFRLHVADMGPLGILMVNLEDWGLHRDDTFRALVAASPATRAPRAGLGALADALRAGGVDPGTVTTLDDVRGVSAEADRLLDAYLDEHGWRLTTGYDIEDRCLAELPDLVAASIRAAATGADHEEGTEDRHLQSLDALRDEVPEAHRAEFDEAVEEARVSYGLRDENGPLTYEWPAGLLRRALLEAGQRLSASERTAAPAEVFELRAAEVGALLRGDPGPTPEEIADRAATRRWEVTLDAPVRLGPEEPPPPIDVFPPNLARITRVILTVVGSLESPTSPEPLHGMGVGTEPYVGTARVVHDASDALAAMEPGDVIVAPYTAPTYNAVLAMAGAVVTEEGGLLCHAAVIARELGLPAVIGASGAMTAIPDGARIEVDPVAGRVRVL